MIDASSAVTIWDGASTTPLSPPFATMGAIEPELFVRECVDAHNKYRYNHGSPPLTIKAYLADSARAWALDLATREVMEPKPDNIYGENLYLVQWQDVNGEFPVKKWYASREFYNYDTGEPVPDAANFTQLIWKATTEVGISYTIKKDTMWIVAHYYPPGNIPGMFIENVPMKIDPAELRRIQKLKDKKNKKKKK